ncbi:MAG TPA: SLC13 family permease [Acidiferrobacterales bacterium]
MNLSVLALLAVFVLIAARRIGRLRVAIWQAMALGAVAVLALGEIDAGTALRAIDVDVMLFLSGMFIVGEALVASGYLYALAYRLFARIGSADALVLAVLLVGGLSSALLMNDTLAIVGTPLALRLAREHDLPPRLMLLALAFAVTTGSVMSPIGNPQNLLIAVHGGLPAPFLTFFAHLALPTLIGLGLAYGVLRWMFRREFHARRLTHAPVTVKDPALARLARFALGLAIALVLVKIALAAAAPRIEFRLSWIALGGALPLLLFSRRRLELLRRVDWRTLTFFAAMFVLMASVWRSGFLQELLAASAVDLKAPATVLSLSVALSQLVSNVPLAALYLPLLGGSAAAPEALMALAAGSTLAGNLLILGAASNVIIIQHAERHGATLTLLDFARAGVPLTLLQLLVYWTFLI